MKTTFASLCGTGRRSYEMEIEKPLYQIVREEKPAGVIALNPFFGIAIFRPAGDECIAAFENENGFFCAHRHVIHYSTGGAPYIKKAGSRYYFRDALRV